MTDSRAEFEAWFNNDDGRCCEPSGYESPHVAALWASWQSARKAALEEAAKVCAEQAAAWELAEKSHYSDMEPEARSGAAWNCADAIRSLADRSPT